MNQRIKEEEKRVQLYIHKSTRERLLKVVDEVMIAAHLERFQGEFQRLLDNDRWEDLQRMYDLLVRLENGIDALRDAFEAHVYAVGCQDLAVVVDSALTDPKVLCICGWYLLKI